MLVTLLLLLWMLPLLQLVQVQRSSLLPLQMLWQRAWRHLTSARRQRACSRRFSPVHRMHHGFHEQVKVRPRLLLPMPLQHGCLRLRFACRLVAACRPHFLLEMARAQPWEQRSARARQ